MRRRQPMPAPAPPRPPRQLRARQRGRRPPASAARPHSDGRQAASCRSRCRPVTTTRRRLSTASASTVELGTPVAAPRAARRPPAPAVTARRSASGGSQVVPAQLRGGGGQRGHRGSVVLGQHDGEAGGGRCAQQRHRAAARAPGSSPASGSSHSSNAGRRSTTRARSTSRRRPALRSAHRVAPDASSPSRDRHSAATRSRLVRVPPAPAAARSSVSSTVHAGNPPPAWGCRTTTPPAVEPDARRRPRGQRGEQAALARAVGPHQPVERARGNAHREAAQKGQGTGSDVQALDGRALAPSNRSPANGQGCVGIDLVVLAAPRDAVRSRAGGWPPPPPPAAPAPGRWPRAGRASRGREGRGCR